MKKLFLCFILVSVCPLLGASSPGERPNRTPGFFGGMLNSIEDLIIKQAKKVFKISDQLDEASDKDGWFSDSPQKKLAKELIYQSEELRNLLASKPSSSNPDFEKKPVSAEASPIEDAKRSNNEVIEVNSSLENLKGLLQKFHTDLAAKPDDLDIAIQYYRIYITCLENIIEMHKAFIKNADSKYLLIIDQKISEIQYHLQKISGGIESNMSEINRNVIKKDISILMNLVQLLEEAKETLAKQKDWAEKNLPLMNETIYTVKVTLETAKIAKSASDLIKAINENFQNLQFLPPPLIVFSINKDDFKLKTK